MGTSTCATAAGAAGAAGARRRSSSRWWDLVGVHDPDHFMKSVLVRYTTCWTYQLFVVG